MNVHDGLEDIRWIRGLGGEKLRAASYALPNPKNGLFFAIGEGSIFFVACFLQSNAQMCLYQTPGQRPPPITGRFVNTVTRGWVGAPNERAPFRFSWRSRWFCRSMLSRTRNLAASNKHLAEFFSGRTRPKIGPGILFFSGFFKSLNHFFRRFALIASGTEIFWRASFKLVTFYGNIALPLSPVLHLV